MITKLPQITGNFIAHIENTADQGIKTQRVDGIEIDVFPYVFPPQSPFSDSTHTLYDFLGRVKGKRVLDIGTGTGIQAIQAAKKGAKKVRAVDIYGPAILCAQHNVTKHNLKEMIDVHYSDVFDNVPDERYGLIIANLPILNCVVEDKKYLSLCDPDFIAHKKLFSQSQKHLEKDGRIILVHADLEGKASFDNLESLANKYDFSANVQGAVHSKGYEWRHYEFKR